MQKVARRRSATDFVLGSNKRSLHDPAYLGIEGLGQAWVVLDGFRLPSDQWEEDVSQEVADGFAKLPARILRPVMLGLERLMVPEASASKAGVGAGSGCESLAELEAFATAVELPHLGERYTRVALDALAVPPVPRSWEQVAAAALPTAARRRRPRATEIEAFVAWEAAAVVSTPGPGILRIHEPGRVFAHGAMPDARGRLVPLFVKVDRAGHAERMALLAFEAAAADAAFGVALVPPAWRGRLQMVTSHLPCLSCIAVICQFARRHPGVHVEVSFLTAGARLRVA